MVLAKFLGTRWAGWLGCLVVVGVGALMAWHQHLIYGRNLAQCYEQQARVVAYAEKAAREQAEEARRVVERVQAEERAALAERAAREQAIEERLVERAEVAEREAREWKARLRESERTSPDCAAWLEEKVRCPVR